MNEKHREFDSPDRGQAEREDILKILQREIRLVVKPESKNWMVKPGCLEKCAEQITAIRKLQPPTSVEATGAGRYDKEDVAAGIGDFLTQLNTAMNRDAGREAKRILDALHEFLFVNLDLILASLRTTPAPSVEGPARNNAR